MNRFVVAELELPGLKCVQRLRVGDSRGFLSRVFCSQELSAAGWTEAIAQVNHTCTRRAGTVRGLHFQHAPHAEMKLVSCLRGSVWDVAVDLRAGSSTLGRWHAELLSADNGRALLIPPGFAHGFQSQCDDVELLYCHSRAYAAQAEDGIHPEDPTLAIAWPRAISELSARDASHPSLPENFKGLAA